MLTIILLLFFIGCSGCIIQKNKDKKNGNYKCFIAIGLTFVLVLIATFRNPEMRDYENYYNCFLYGAAEWKEKSFTLISSYTSQNRINPLWAFFFFACLSIGIKMYDVLRLSPFFWGSIIVWLGSIYILHDLIQIRAAVASSILLLSIVYIYKRKLLKFLCCICVAYLFHYSAIIFLGFYFLSPYKFNNKLYLIIIPISYFCALSGLTIGNLVSKINIESIQIIYAVYEYENEPLNIFNLLQLLRVLTATILMFNIKTLIEKYPLSVILIKIYVIGIISLVLFSDITTFAVRISELILTIEILAVPLVVYTTKISKKIYAKLYVIGYSIIFLLMEVYYLNYLAIY